MNKFSLYKPNICKSRSTISYGKGKSIGVDRGTASRTRTWLPYGGETLFPHALPCSSSESRWTFCREGRSTDGDEFCIRKRMGKAVQGRRHKRSAYPFRPWAEAHHGLLGQDAVRRAIEQDRQCVGKAKAAWELATGKEASNATFKRFLSALAQDISV